MDLNRLIRNYSLENETVDTIVSVLNAKTIEIHDNKFYTWQDMAIFMGVTNTEKLRVTLEQNGLEWVVHQLGGIGIQLSQSFVQGELSKLLGSFPELVVLLEKGIKFISPFEDDGGINDVTVGEVTAALPAAKTESAKKLLRKDAQARFDKFSDDLDSWNGSGEAPQL